MTFHQAVAQARERLAAAGIAEAALEAEVLVMHSTGASRAQLYVSFPDPLPTGASEALETALHRRLNREPLAYVTGHREFFGLEFLVDRRAPVPRQETETLVERAVEIAARHFSEGACRIADVGTGCGAIAVSLATALPDARVDAIDSSSDALELSTLNCRRHDVADRVALLHGELLDPVVTPLDMVVANLPYIPEGEWGRLQPEIRLFEPPHGLLSGRGGLDHVFRLLGQTKRLTSPPSWLLLELGEDQAQAVVGEATRLFPGAKAEVYRDLNGLDRGVILSGLAVSSTGGGQRTATGTLAARLGN